MTWGLLRSGALSGNPLRIRYPGALTTEFCPCQGVSSRGDPLIRLTLFNKGQGLVVELFFPTVSFFFPRWEIFFSRHWTTGFSQLKLLLHGLGLEKMVLGLGSPGFEKFEKSIQAHLFIKELISV